MALHSVLDLDGFHIRNVESDRSENLAYTITLCFSHCQNETFMYNMD